MNPPRCRPKRPKSPGTSAPARRTCCSWYPREQPETLPSALPGLLRRSACTSLTGGAGSGMIRSSDHVLPSEVGSFASGMTSHDRGVARVTPVRRLKQVTVNSHIRPSPVGWTRSRDYKNRSPGTERATGKSHRLLAVTTKLCRLRTHAEQPARYNNSVRITNPCSLLWTRPTLGKTLRNVEVTVPDGRKRLATNRNTVAIFLIPDDSITGPKDRLIPYCVQSVRTWRLPMSYRPQRGGRQSVVRLPEQRERPQRFSQSQYTRSWVVQPPSACYGYLGSK